MPRLLPEFLAKYPQVRVQLHVSNRRVDIINEGFDVALRVRTKLDDDGSLVMRSFGQIQELLVASPGLPRRMGRPKHPDELTDHVTLSMNEDEARQRWELHGPEGDVRRVELKPRVAGFDFPMLMALAQQGVGITHAAGDRLRRSRAQWRTRSGAAAMAPAAGHLARGVRLASRPVAGGAVLIDFLAERMPALIEESRLHCRNCPPGTDKHAVPHVERRKPAAVTVAPQG